jgi:hypothetical protein
MASLLAATTAACCLAAALLDPTAAATQSWNDDRTLALVRRATERRAQQLADTGLTDYRASARGYLTFLAQFGEGFSEPPKVVKADELALEVYWRAPDLSKQRIIGRRDTLLLPTDISYHRDHLGIVQNNFPAIIRLGEGDEVRDVPHPLSPTGAREYDFAIDDSVRIRLAGRTVDAYRVSVRPRDDRRPRVIGAMFIDRQTAEVARMAFSFTRAAFLDAQLENISIVLENALIGARFWLPSRQEIEIVRTGSWLDYPARGIIRGRWEICCYEVNQGIDPAFLRGPEIVQMPASVLGRFEWSGRILDSLPADVRASSDETIRAVQAEARRLVRAEALARVRRSALSARRISDFVRVNRVEGLALGVGVSRTLGAGFGANASGRWGFGDDRARGRVGLSFTHPSGTGVTIIGERDLREAGDIAEVSLLRNSFAAQEFGSDYTEPFEVRGLDLDLALGQRLGIDWGIRGRYQRQGSSAVNASPSSGTYTTTIPALDADVVDVALGASRPLLPIRPGLRLGTRVDLRWAAVRPLGLPGTERVAVARGFAELTVEGAFGDHHRLVASTSVGAVDAGRNDVPAQYLVYLGGPVSAPGYDYHHFAGEVAAGQRLEWRMLVPFVPVSLGRFGTAPGAATIAPYVHVAYVGRPASIRGSESGWFPSLGVGTLMLFDLVRFDVARGLRDGRWTFSVDLTRDLWPVL